MSFVQSSNEIQLTGEKRIGGKNPCLVMVEVTGGVAGSFEDASAVIDRAVASQVDAISFSFGLVNEDPVHHEVNSHETVDTFYGGAAVHSIRLSQYRSLGEECASRGVLFGAVPQSLASAVELREVVSFFQVGVNQLENPSDLEAIARLGKPLFLSVGKVEMDRVSKITSMINPHNSQVVYLNGELGASTVDLAYGALSQLKSEFGMVVGYSDPRQEHFACFGALAQGADVIVKRVVPEWSDEGLKLIGLEDYGLTSLVDGIRKIEPAMGNEKKVHAREAPIRAWAHRSIVTIRPVKAGEIFSLENLWCKRPGTGIPSSNLFEVLGSVATRDIPENQLLRLDDYTELPIAASV